jgi:hypothetical protein
MTRPSNSLPVTIGLLALSAVTGCDPRRDDSTVELGAVEDALGRDGSGRLDGSEDPFSAPPTPGLLRLQDLSEAQLAALFAGGGATRIPLGVGRGWPLLAGRSRTGLNSAFNRVASVLWAGKTLEHRRDESGRPQYRPAGPDGVADPVVTLTNRIAGVADVFKAEVTRQPVAGVRIDPAGTVAPPRQGERLAPYLLSVFADPIPIDERPSVLLNYNADVTPVINRVLDEIREVDAALCPGLYLGRAHIRPLTQDGWQFWTYFALDFGFDMAGRRCDQIPVR